MKNDSGPLYPNQPLIEVATEIRFCGNLAVEICRHRFQGQIQDRYPLLFLPAAQQGVAPMLQHCRFETEDRLSGVQLAVNSFNYYSRSYPGAPSFISEALNLFQYAHKLIGDIDITRIGWRYMNAIPFIREDNTLPLARYFSDQSLFGPLLKREFTSASFDMVAVVDEARQRVALSTAHTKGAPEEEALLIDIDTFIRGEDVNEMPTADVPALIDRVHDLGRSAFEALISDSYRAFLKGESDEGSK